MYSIFKKLFRRDEPPNVTFVDAELGEFAFEQRLGWKKRILLGRIEAEIVFGSDGEPPSGTLVHSAKAWIEAWENQLPKIHEYIRAEFGNWADEPNLPDPRKLEVESLNFLWKDRPEICLIYFNSPGDDDRLWHVTLDGFDPQAFAYDD